MSTPRKELETRCSHMHINHFFAEKKIAKEAFKKPLPHMRYTFHYTGKFNPDITSIDILIGDTSAVDLNERVQIIMHGEKDYAVHVQDIMNPENTSQYSYDLTSNFQIRTYLFLSKNMRELKIGILNDDENAIALGYERKDIDPIIPKKYSNEEENFLKALNEKNEMKSLALLKNIKNVNLVDPDGYPILARAAQLNLSAVVVGLVEAKADLERRTSRNHGEKTAFLAAAAAGHDNITLYLACMRADINAQTNKGRTALHYLVSEANSQHDLNNKIKLTEILIRDGANPSLANIYDNRPVDHEVNAYNQAIVSLFHKKTRETDVIGRITHIYVDKKGAFFLAFNSHISTKDQDWAWEAIVNTIKSLKFKDELGLASDITPCKFRDRDHVADTVIPDCKEYVIHNISEYDLEKTKQPGIIIALKDTYCNNKVLNKLIQAKLLNICGLESVEECDIPYDKPETEKPIVWIYSGLTRLRSPSID